MSSSILPIKICHLADIHLGFRRFSKLAPNGQNQREFDINQAFSEAIDRIIQIKPQLVLIAGDLFHLVRPSNLILTFCFQQIKRLVSAIKVPVVIVAGNHETPKMADTGSALQLLAEINNVYIATNEIHRFDFSAINVSVTAIPQCKTKDLIVRPAGNLKYNILLIHGQVNGTNKYYGPAEVELKNLNLELWDYVALGHVHDMQKVADNTYYAGAIEHTSNNIWDDSTEKGFIEIDLPVFKTKFHRLTSPRQVFDCAPIDAKNLNADELNIAIAATLDKIPGGVTGKLIRLSISNLNRNIYKLIDHKIIKNYRTQASSLTLDFKFDSNSKNLINLAGERSGSLYQDLKAFIAAENIDLPDLNYELLANYLSKAYDHQTTKA